jgi:hypothetical protein
MNGKRLGRHAGIDRSAPDRPVSLGSGHGPAGWLLLPEGLKQGHALTCSILRLVGLARTKD